MYNLFSAPNFNTWFVPAVTALLVAVIGGVLVQMFKRYLEKSDENHVLRNDAVLKSVSNLDEKVTRFCRDNHDEHLKLDNKLVNHDHAPETGRPRFYT